MSRITETLRRHGGFAAQVATLMSGHGAALAISLLATPLIARIFVPADFGVVAVLLAVVQPLVVIGTLQLGMALVLPADTDAAQKLFDATLTWLLGVCVTLYALAGVLTLAGVQLPFAARVGGWLWVVPAWVALLGLLRVVVGWLTRGQHFGAIARGEVTAAGVGAGARLGLGVLTGSSVWALIVGNVMGVLAQFAVLRRERPESDTHSHLQPPGEAARTISQYREFPLFDMPGAFLATLSQSIPVLVLGSLYSALTAGLFAMAVRLIGAPGRIMANAVRRVFLQRAASLRNSGHSLRGPHFKTTATLVLLGIAPAMILWLFGTELMTLLLGARWAEAGRYAEILAPLLFSQWVGAPSAALIVVLRRQDITFVARLVELLGQGAVFALAFLQARDAGWAIAAFVAVRISIELGLIVTAAMLVRRPHPVH